MLTNKKVNKTIIQCKNLLNHFFKVKLILEDRKKYYLSFASVGTYCFVQTGSQDFLCIHSSMMFKHLH